MGKIVILRLLLPFNNSEESWTQAEGPGAAWITAALASRARLPLPELIHALRETAEPLQRRPPLRVIRVRVRGVVEQRLHGHRQRRARAGVERLLAGRERDVDVRLVLRQDANHLGAFLT